MAPQMLEVAREKAREKGLTNVEFRLVDGEELDVDPDSFDAVTCRWGIMFMPDPVRLPEAGSSRPQARRAHRCLGLGPAATATPGRPTDDDPA